MEERDGQERRGEERGGPGGNGTDGDGSRVLIGVITRDRLTDLQATVAAVRRHTRPERFALFVADDGSRDGTQAWLAAQGIPFASGRTGGTGRNRNRVLLRLQAALSEFSHCVILDDDARPTDDGWLDAWTAFADAHNAGGYKADDFAPVPGAGTVADPYRAEGAGCCLCLTAETFRRVGFVSPAFYADSPAAGWGYEDSEWSARVRALPRPSGLTGPLSMCFGVTHRSDAPRWVTGTGLAAHRAAFEALQGAGPCVDVPWRSEEERGEFESEVCPAVSG